jgi:tripartite-type tricarboxylate transporter receptor subunit TctC
VRIVAGTAPAGRAIGSRGSSRKGLEKLWSASVVVEARGGADGTIAAESVARAPADGYTLFMGGQSNLALVVAQGRSLRYDPVADFAPIGRIARGAAGARRQRAAIGRTTLAELIAIAKAAPGTLTYGSTGMQSRLAAELLKAAAGVDIVEVPYKSSPAALADLLAARIEMVFFDASVVAPHAEAGTLRLLAAAGARRIAVVPTVATLDELGFRGLRVEPWYGLVAPAKTPPDVLARLRKGLAELRRLPEFQSQLQQLGYEPIDDTPEQFSAEIIGDIERFAAIVKAAKLGPPP